ncbi:MAG: sugar transferase [Candidatus Sulfotelmatobacter sp.]
MFDWILVAQIYLLVHAEFPRMPAFAGLSRTAPFSPGLIGIALLHGVLINLLSYCNTLQKVDRPGETRMLARAVFWGTVVLSAALQLQGFSFLAVVAVWSAGLLHFGALWGGRRIEQKSSQRGLYVTHGMRNVLIVGAGPLGRRIASYLGEHPEMGRFVCGFLDDRKPLGNGVIGRTSNLVELARIAFADEVILAPPHDQDVTLRVLHTSRQLRLDVKIVPYLFGCEPVGKTEKIGSTSLISLHEEKLPGGALLLKRALDIAGASITLFLTAPVLMLVALLIKLESPGPVLYKALRAGHKRRPFYCYKFRTMVTDADKLKEGLREHNQRSGPVFKIKNDPRITRLGRFLRRYSLDELPQLWNVLRGEMSMVGPRPHPMDDVCTYAIEHLCRLDVLPGMTGLWQVKGRQNPSFQTAMNLDVEYIHSWSVGMDLRILFRTAGAVFRGSGE